MGETEALIDLVTAFMFGPDSCKKFASPQSINSIKGWRMEKLNFLPSKVSKLARMRQIDGLHTIGFIRLKSRDEGHNQNRHACSVSVTISDQNRSFRVSHHHSTLQASRSAEGVLHSVRETVVAVGIGGVDRDNRDISDQHRCDSSHQSVFAESPTPCLWSRSQHTHSQPDKYFPQRWEKQSFARCLMLPSNTTRRQKQHQNVSKCACVQTNLQVLINTCIQFTIKPYHLKSRVFRRIVEKKFSSRSHSREESPKSQFHSLWLLKEQFSSLDV